MLEGQTIASLGPIKGFFPLPFQDDPPMIAERCRATIEAVTKGGEVMPRFYGGRIGKVRIHVESTKGHKGKGKSPAAPVYDARVDVLSALYPSEEVVGELLSHISCSVTLVIDPEWVKSNPDCASAVPVALGGIRVSDEHLGQVQRNFGFSILMIECNPPQSKARHLWQVSEEKFNEWRSLHDGYARNENISAKRKFENLFLGIERKIKRRKT